MFKGPSLDREKKKVRETSTRFQKPEGISARMSGTGGQGGLEYSHAGGLQAGWNKKMRRGIYTDGLIGVQRSNWKTRKTGLLLGHRMKGYRKKAQIKREEARRLSEEVGMIARKPKTKSGGGGGGIRNPQSECRIRS